MSDSDESGITHTEVSSPFEDLSDIGSPRADDHELLELPYMPEDPYLEAALQAPPSPDYVPGPEEPEHAPPSPDYVPGAEHVDDEIVAEDQPYAEDASPIALSPDYVPESDPEADPRRGEDADMDIDADEEDEDDEMDVEIDEEAEEEHSAPAYPVVVALPATAPFAEETEPHYLYQHGYDSEVARLLAISSPPASPLSPWSSSPPQIPFPLSPPSPVLTAPPPSPIRSLGYRAATIRMRAEAAATSHSLPLPPPFILSPTRPDAPPPLPTSAFILHSNHILLPSNRRVEGQTSELTFHPRMGLDCGFVATMDRQVRRDPSRIMFSDMGLKDSWR
ncbi:hypothetical protein Tco_1421074 [Tanacetum coccineum]